MSHDQELDRILPLSSTTFHVLVSLASGPGHGYGIAQEVEELTGGTIVMGPGTLYGTLKRMVEAGLIVETGNPGDEGLHAERRRYYEVTSLGRAALAAESERLLHAARVALERLGG